MRSVNYKGLTGEIVDKSSKKYNASIICWNRAIEKYPLVIIYCFNEGDVINAIKWARENKIEIRVRSGAHSYEGYSTGNDVAIIDVSNINKISINEEKKIAKIGGGVRNREAYEAFGSKGYAFPGGGCPTVGVPGLILGGGWGYSSRLLGLASDSLLEAEIIDYKGNKLIANKNENSDLYWALKGSGGCNFGVITSMTIKIKEKADMGTLIYINYPNITKENNIKLVLKLQEIYKGLDRSLNIKTAIYNSKEKGRGVKITGLFYGKSSKARELLKPLLDITNNIEITLDDKSILECNRWIQNSHPDYEKYKSTGRFVNRDYTENEIETLIEIIDNPSKGYDYTAISFYGAGGAIKDVNKLDSAYYYRDANFIMGIQSVWLLDKYAEDNRIWIKDNFRIVESLTKGSFVNFPLNELENYEEEYYGENLKKLKKIKEKYDPYNFFDYPQAIKKG